METGEDAKTEEVSGKVDNPVNETENPAMPEEKKEYILTTYISEYFLLDTASLPEEITAETVSIKNQKGEDTEILRLTEHLQMEKITEDYYALTVPVTLRPEYQLSWEKNELIRWYRMNPYKRIRRAWVHFYRKKQEKNFRPWFPILPLSCW